MSAKKLSYLASAALAIAAPQAAALAQVAAPPAPVQAVTLPTAAAVASVYDRWQMQPLWFRGSIPAPAAAQLLGILRRAPVDGLASGPQLAAQVDAAIAQAASGNPEAIKSAERTLSAAWVLYVQTVKRPTPGMIYAYEVLQPQGTRADQILLAAQAASSLEQHLASAASVNPIYAGIRDAEWARMQAAGSATPDPRVLTNLERLRSIPARGRFVLVDSGSQRLFMYENGVPVDSMKVIVGTDELPTPMIASVMYYVTYNPYWNAPDHLVRGPIAAKTLAGGMKYFNSMGYQVMADWTSNSAVIPADTVDWKTVAAGKTRLRIRQDPGPKNFMGVLKFPFPNPEDIYLHDTPAKDLFKQSQRTLSNGCVRLEDAARFGRWLLGREPVPPSSEPETPVQLPQGVPIYVTYITAQPSNGQLTFSKDVYGWDRPGAAQMAAAEMAASRTPRN